MEKEFEQKHLKEILEFLKEKLKGAEEEFEIIAARYARDPEHNFIAYDLAKDKLRALANGVIKPYFARIDFKADDNLEKEKLYIGKYGIMNNESKSLITDWRAPIASLYYDSELGKVSYVAPEGDITGELFLKRQFEIEDGELLNYFDVDIVSNDQLLQKYLQVNNDMRLKNIVSTIQKEQNYAIRRPINENTIIQGVAGSGKTTVALHRIAYLAYNYKDRIKNNQYLVIGPNDVFLKYIKSVLPDLDVSDIRQETYENLAKNIIDEEINIKPSNKKLNMYLSGKLTDDIPKYKSSLEYKNILDAFLDNYFKNIIKKSMVIKDFEVIPSKEFKHLFDRALKETSNMYAASDRFVLLVDKYVKDHYDEIASRLSDEIATEFKQAKTEAKKNEIRSKKTYILDNIKKGCKQEARKYIGKYNLRPTKIYKTFIESIDEYVDDYKYLKELKNETLSNIKEKLYDFEDLASLIHIRFRLGLDNSFKNYRHVVIDEAQDLGKFNFYVLKECLPSASFSIYGDIAQSIYDYRSIDSWDDLNEIFTDTKFIPFKKSYRTTDEIMGIANQVSKHLNLEESELSIRHGENVLFSHVESESIPEYIKNKIEEFKQKGYKTIAIISKYPMQSNYINDDLYDLGIKVPNISESTDINTIDWSVVTIPNYLAKGLEFDAVILNDVSEHIYNSNKALDMKMLYVALTRALHEMDVVYSKEITKPLKKVLTKDKRI